MNGLRQSVEARLAARHLPIATPLGVAIALPAPAHAAQIVQSVSLTDDGLAPIIAFGVDRFDLSLGELTGV